MGSEETATNSGGTGRFDPTSAREIALAEQRRGTGTSFDGFNSAVADHPGSFLMTPDRLIDLYQITTCGK